MKEQKKELRRQIATLQTQHRECATRWSADILARLEAHRAFREAGIVLLYHSLPGEVDTHAFIGRWSPRKRILLPVVQGDTTYGVKEEGVMTVSGDWFYVKLETNDVLIVQVDSNKSYEPRELMLELTTYNDREFVHITQMGNVKPIK